MRENGKSLDALFSSARLTTQEVFGAVVSGTASAEQVSLVGRQLVRLERMSIGVTRALEGGADSAAAAIGLKRDVADFVKTTARPDAPRRGSGGAPGYRAPGESVR
jgi:predicted PP-loop superfamily ATPase